MGRPELKRTRRTPAGPPPSPRPETSAESSGALDADRFGRWSERVRRLALGLTAALIVARAYWPGEATDEASSGQGLGWVVGLLIAALLGLVAVGLSGRLRVRLSWPDAAAIALFVLVSASAGHAAERRIGVNLAWQWAGVGLAYVLLRQLPRSPREVTALTVVFLATAVSLTAYGLYQVGVVQPETRRLYRLDPEAALREAGVPNDPAARRQFEDRLLGSKEPLATFALTNSLAGSLVAPLVVLIAAGGAAASGGRPRRYLRMSLTVLLSALVLTALLLTKSRTAFVGLLAGLGVAALRAVRVVPIRWLLAAGAGVVAVAGILVALGLAAGQLDREVLTESTKSLRYRWEFWQGTWGVLSEDATWWRGVGPGSFAGPYLRHKRPESSEAIRDPHNAFLEVGATAGLPALLAFLGALGLGLWEVLGPAGEKRTVEGKSAKDNTNENPTSEGMRTGSLLLWAGLGGWLLAMVLRPDLSPFARSINPFEGDLARWVVVGGAWALSAWLLRRWDPAPGVLAGALGAGIVALFVNFLGAGGIGFAPQALVLWSFLALGQVARADRPCGRLRHVGAPGWSFGMVMTWVALLAAWSALVGTFAGTVGPHWAAEAALARGDARTAEAREAWRRAAEALPPGASAEARVEAGYAASRGLFNAAAAWYQRAAYLDRFAARPWLAWARLELEGWRARGSPAQLGEWVWHRIDSMLDQASTPPRDPASLAVAMARVHAAREVLGRPGWPAAERRRILSDYLDAARTVTRLHPTSAIAFAELAEVAADARQLDEARQAAETALELDCITPHEDKKLPPALRARMTERMLSPVQ
jgi:tetratricopeptide (TPR) repeat protein